MWGRGFAKSVLVDNFFYSIGSDRKRKRKRSDSDL